MPLKSFLNLNFAIALLIAFNSCKQQEEHNSETENAPEQTGVYGFYDKQEVAEVKKMNLDESHPNMLNPAISKSEHEAVMESWSGLHKKMSEHLQNNNFNWEVKDSTITIFHKIYFKPNGEISNYIFKVNNKNVTDKKKEEFSELITSFAQNARIEFQKNETFAQCGKTRYSNL